MIFKDTFRFSPVIYEHDLPHKEDYFHITPDGINKEIISNSVVDSIWWNKQKDRCLNGYYVDDAIDKGGDALVDGIDAIWTGNDCYLPEYDVRIINRRVWISGRLYFYLNFWPIYGLKLGARFKDLINPKFLMLDFLFASRVEQCFAQMKDMEEAKARQLGFSEKIAGMMVGYNYTFIPASVNIIIGGTEADSEHMFENTVRGLDYLRNTQFYKIRSINKMSDLFIKAKNFKSEVRALTAKDKPQAISRYCFGKNTKVRMFNGSIKNIQDILIGDKLMGIDSKERIVKDVHAGIDQMYKISSIKTDSFICNANHLLYCYHKPMLRKKLGNGKYVQNNFNYPNVTKVDDNHFLIRAEDYYNSSLTFKRYSSIEKSIGIEYKKKKQLIDPYFLGLWLGDGEVGTLRFTVNIEEKEILEYLTYFAFYHCCEVKIEPPTFCKFLNRDSKACRVRISYRDRIGKSYKPMKNYLIEEMKKLKILRDKFIPKKYLFSSRDDRLLLLAGLIDTDGWRVKTKEGFEHYAISQVNKKLIYQIKELCESLGFYTNISEPKYNGNINGYKSQPIFELYISGENIHHIPVRLEKKKIKQHNYIKNPLHSVFTIEKLNQDKYYGIEIDGDQLFLLQDYTIVHNSPTLVVYEEIGKWKKGLIRKTKKFVDISLWTETTKTGLSVDIGTGGDMKAGAADMERMVYNPKANNFVEYNNRWTKEGDNLALSKVGHFSPKWMYKIVDKDGNPQKEESLIKIEAEILNVPPDERITERANQACYLNEMFLIPGGGFFGEEIVGNLNAQKSDINTHKDLKTFVKNYRLEWIDKRDITKGVKAIQDDEKGWCKIHELPTTHKKTGEVIQNLYGAATDSYDYDEALTSSSKGSCWIYKRLYSADQIYRTWVAGYVERPETAEGGADLFYERCAMLCVFYRAINLIEWSKIRIFDWFKRNNLTSYLKERPQFVLARLIKDTKQVNEYGIDPATKPEWLKSLRDHLAEPENIKKVYFVDLLEAWANFKYDPSGKKYNCDITISTSLNLILEEDERLLEIGREEPENKRRSFPVYSTDEDGNFAMSF